MNIFCKERIKKHTACVVCFFTFCRSTDHSFAGVYSDNNPVGRKWFKLDTFCKEQKKVQREKQKEFKANNPELFDRYPKFSKALAKVLDPSDEIKPAATEEQIWNQESVLDFALPSQVRAFFLLTAGIQVSTGMTLSLSRMFDLTIHGERYCVLGEFWKEADGDQLLLRPGEDTIWYYAHEQDKVKRLCNDMTELLEKKLAGYLNAH